MAVLIQRRDPAIRQPTGIDADLAGDPRNREPVR